MNPIVFAMRHPITQLMLVVALIGGGVLAFDRMRVDIFPAPERAADLRDQQLMRAWTPARSKGSSPTSTN